MDGNTIEYGLCNTIPSFYVVVFDTNCLAWETNYQGNGGYDLGNYNAEGVCRARSEYYFIYQQNDAIQLQYLDSVINLWIPNDNAFIIYTPLSINFQSINSSCPQLGQTLLNNWGSSIEEARMAVMFGVKGYPNSYKIDTTIVSGKIEFIDTICPNVEQTAGLFIFEQTNNEILVVPNPIDSEVTIRLKNKRNIKKIEIYNDQGTKIKEIEINEVVNDELHLPLSELMSGAYIIKLIDLKNNQIASSTVIKK